MGGGLVAAGHADRPVRETVLDGRAVVVKDYLLGGASQVAEAMRALWASPFGASRRPPGLPEPIGLVGGSLIMERIAGTPVGSRGSLGETARVADSAAALLADLHASDVRLPRRRTVAHVVRSVGRKAADLADTPVGPAFADAAGRLARQAPRCEELVPSHGDFSPRNVLMAAGGLRLIDYDRLQLAAPARDVAYWGAWAWATERLARAEPSWELGERFVDAYGAAAGRLALDERQLAFHRAAGLLRIAHGWSGLRRRPELACQIVAEAVVLLRR